MPNDTVRPEPTHTRATSAGYPDGGDPMFEQPALRRLWLLQRAMRALPLDAALKAAAQAEAFVLGVADAEHIEQRPSVPDKAQARNAIEPRTWPGRSEILLKPNRKAELLSRLEHVASNTALAVEFGLTPRQIQGFRMQRARAANRRQPEIINGTTQIKMASAVSLQPAMVNEVVHYLQQQGDVIVGSPQTGFLVNKRFKLDFQQLQDRANTMRYRQGKPEFGARLPVPVNRSLSRSPSPA